MTFFEDGLLRISPRCSLNDPFELLPAKPNFQEWMIFMNQCKDFHLSKLVSSQADLKTLKKEELYWEKYIKAELDYFGDKKAKTFYNHSWTESMRKIDEIGGVISLSSRWDSSLMWAHYSNSHNGFCIGFNIDKIRENIGGIFEVLYSDSRYKIRLGETSEVNFNVFYTKSKDWSYEQEYRVIKLFSEADQVLKFDSDTIYLTVFVPDLISEIIIGSRASLDIINTIQQFCDKHSIQLFRAIEADYTFNMDRLKV